MIDTLTSKGWIYYDPEVKFSPEYWDRFLEIIGEGNYEILVLSQYNGPDPWKRGQLMISPEGVANLQAFPSTQKEENGISTSIKTEEQ